MAYHVSFEASETYLHKNVMGEKGKKVNFQKACKHFSMLHGQLRYDNRNLVISFTERQHTKISDVYEVLGHDPKARAMASHCGSDT